MGLLGSTQRHGKITCFQVRQDQYRKRCAQQRPQRYRPQRYSRCSPDLGLKKLLSVHRVLRDIFVPLLQQPNPRNVETDTTVNQQLEGKIYSHDLYFFVAESKKGNTQIQVINASSKLTHFGI